MSCKNSKSKSNNTLFPCSHLHVDNLKQAKRKCKCPDPPPPYTCGHSNQSKTPRIQKAARKLLWLTLWRTLVWLNYFVYLNYFAFTSIYYYYVVVYNMIQISTKCSVLSQRSCSIMSGEFQMTDFFHSYF